MHKSPQGLQARHRAQREGHQGFQAFLDQDQDEDGDESEGEEEDDDEDRVGCGHHRSRLY